MAREDFLVNLRNASYDLDVRPRRERPPPESVRLLKALNDAAVWLTPDSDTGFNPADFPELSASEVGELQERIAQFLGEVRATPAPRVRAQQVRKGLYHFRRIVELVRRPVVVEWQEALDLFMKDAEDWSHQRDWGVKRDVKRMEEEILGVYDAPRLLIHTLENQRFFLDPAGRHIVSASGRVDLCMIPSYDSLGIVRDEKGWYVRSELRPESKRPWTRAVFYKTMDRLAKAA